MYVICYTSYQLTYGVYLMALSNSYNMSFATHHISYQLSYGVYSMGLCMWYCAIIAHKGKRSLNLNSLQFFHARDSLIWNKRDSKWEVGFVNCQDKYKVKKTHPVVLLAQSERAMCIINNTWQEVVNIFWHIWPTRLYSKSNNYSDLLRLILFIVCNLYHLWTQSQNRKAPNRTTKHRV